jgi:ABC-2 type transport system permease protein
MKNNWISALLKLNAMNMTHNKKTFFIMIAALCLNSLIYFGLWVILFSKISSLRGWNLSDIAFLLGSSTIGLGTIFCIMGGSNSLARCIQSGQLDVHMARPRSILLLALMERMRADNLGDILSGIIMIATFSSLSWAQLPLIIVLSLTAGLVFFSFRLFVHSLAFWGASDGSAENGFIAFLISGTNPQKGLGVYMKLAFLTIFPAGYAGLLPVEIIHNFRWDYFALQIGGSLSLTAFSVWFFYYGLRRYSSGNNFVVLR